MAEKESRSIGELVASGATPSALRLQSKGSGNDLVTVQDWQACYGSNGLVESCTVTAKNTGSSITSVGLLAYSADDQTLYCSQFTAGIASTSVSASVTTEGFNLQVGEKMLGVVFGYIEGVEFFFEETLTLVACGP